MSGIETSGRWEIASKGPLVAVNSIIQSNFFKRSGAKLMTSIVRKSHAFNRIIGCALLFSVSSSTMASESDSGELDHRRGIGVFLGATHVHGHNESTLESLIKKVVIY